MTDHDHIHDNNRRTPLDDQLDAALANYAAVEPRAGLEERILAHLQAERARPTRVAWWRWATVAACALVLVALLAWRLDRSGQNRAVRHPAIPQRQVQPQVEANAANTRRPIPPPVRKHRRNPVQAPLTPAAQPKLDQFPSPEPLSEQEKLLADYVADHPEQAVLMAQARMEALRRDAEEKQKAAADNQDSQP